MSRQQYSPNPSPMVPDPVSLQEATPPTRPPPIPSHNPSHLQPPTPGWTQAQHQHLNAFPQGYPTATPYAPFMAMNPPSSYYNPPVVLPQNVPPTPDAAVGSNGFSNDWVGPANGWNHPSQQTPYNGPQPHTGFSAFQQPLPGMGGGPPPGQWGGPVPPGAFNSSPAAAWHAVPPGVYPPGIQGGPWTQPPGWGGALPSVGVHTPWAGGGGGGGGGPWQQQQPPPPVVPQPPAAPAYRDRSNEGLDQADKFAVGPGHGPVLTPLIFRIVNATLTINPILSPPDTSLENPYLKWNMLFSASHCVRSDDPPQRSWSRGRSEPATHPRLTTIKIVSRMFPWTITVNAGDDKAGVTCGEVIDRLDDFLHKNLKREDADQDTPGHKAERDAAYYHNRSVAIGVPGGRLGDGLRRLDWLCKDTMFGGLMVDEGHVQDAYSAVVPGVVTLVCTTRYPLTEQEMKEQEAREKEEEKVKVLEERTRMFEQRALEAEARERETRARRSRSRSRSSRAATISEADDDEDEDDD